MNQQPATRKKKSLIGALGSLVSASRTLPVPSVSFQPVLGQKLESYEDTQTKDPRRTTGITAVKIAGVLDFGGSAAEPVLGQKTSGFANLSLVSVSQLRDLKRAGIFTEILLGLSITPAVYIHVENSEMQTLMASPRSSGRQRILMTDRNQVSERVSKKRTAKVSPATALALKCLAEGETTLFAEIVQVNPRGLMSEICALPLQGNLLSGEALLALLRTFSPRNGESLQADERLRLQSEAAIDAISFYYRFPPLQGLEAHLPKLLTALSKTRRSEDLLIQSPKLFLAEVTYLLQELLHVTNHSRLTTAAVSQTSAVKEAGWQAATLIGASFFYASQFAQKLNEDLSHVEHVIKGTFEVMTAAAGAASSSGPIPSSATDSTGVIVGKLADVVAQWAARPNEELDLRRLASDLSYLSDSLKRRAKKGLLVWGSQELVQSEYDLLSREEHAHRTHFGRIFEEHYSRYLLDFKDNYLQRNLKKTIGK